jgi:hypothetical protein
MVCSNEEKAEMLLMYGECEKNLVSTGDLHGEISWKD